MNNDDFSSVIERLDLYSMLRDVVRNLWAIILAAAAVAMIVNMNVRSDFQSTYSTTATFVVTSKTSSNYAYSNLSAASSMADSFTNILNSRLLRKKVCEDLGISSFNARTSANVIQGTNLMTLQVTADSPWNTYRIIRSIMKNIGGLTQYVSDDMVMEVLQEPPVPTGADASFSAFNQTREAFLVAFFVVALAFMYLSYMKATIKSEKDMEDKLDAKSLGMVYYDPTYRSLGALLRREKNRHIITDIAAPFEFVERYKKISANISAKAQQSGARIILVTSLREHEGKSTVSANLALSLAQQSYSVLLIDGDMRRPTQNHVFLKAKDKLQHSLVDLLQGKASMAEALRYDAERGIRLLLNDRNYPNSTDIVSSPMMEKLLNVASKHFDYVIVDSPPMSLMADAEVLADRADLSVLVVRYDHSLAPELNDAIDSLRDCRAEFAGCVLNEVQTMPGMRHTVGGYGGYGRYSHYRRYGDYNAYGHYATQNEDSGSERKNRSERRDSGNSRSRSGSASPRSGSRSAVRSGREKKNSAPADAAMPEISGETENQGGEQV